jgi:hypothetical protein
MIQLQALHGSFLKWNRHAPIYQQTISQGQGQGHLSSAIMIIIKTVALELFYGNIA